MAQPSDRAMPIVEIPVDEYIDLREKAQMNAYLMRELEEFKGRLYEFDNRLGRMEGVLWDGKRNGRE